MSNKRGSGDPVPAGSHRRFGVDERREQLLTIGTELFATLPYEQVEIGEIARRAQVSRGLLYHYFPGKRAFFTAVVAAEAERLGELTTPDPQLPSAEQIRASIDAYLDYVDAHPHGYRAVHRGAVSADAEIRTLVDKAHAQQQQRVLHLLDPDQKPPPLLRTAVRGWLAFLTSTCLDYLDHDQTHDRDSLRDLCADLLLAIKVNAETTAKNTR